MTPRLRMVGAHKSFGATHALKNVSFEVAPGQVHALIGENGAGKSTLMKILSGACPPDGGRIELDGQVFVPRDPLHARRNGIAMIYQELNLAPHLSVADNILLGEEPHRAGWMDRSRQRAVARKVLSELHHENISPDAPISRLTIAEQQIVEIARALTGSPKVLIMDEPTSSLTQADTLNLFDAIDRLRQRGVSIIYISHFLEECQRIADCYTVLRDGESVGSGDMARASLSAIIRLMVGREVKDIYPRHPHRFGESVLEFRALRGATKPRSVDLALREGEILGIAGLIGAGRTETLRACFGLDRVESGEIFVYSRESTHRSPARRLGQQIGLLSENRKEEGLLLNRTLADNLTLTRFRPVSRWSLVSGRRQRQCAMEWMERLDVRANSPDQMVGELSGGNQQKVAICRLLHHNATIFLLDEPTRGIDVGSKVQIYKLLDELAAQGKAIIFVSSYLPELLGVCDTIGVMCRGVLSAVRPVTDWNEHTLMAAATGQSGPPTF
ncbi:MAG TPA: sugar ABC transporter ATP-binding protein [Candidatus Angelobacter sp.]|nr:sugar ABC transporter ATP-binding protein [Candidatus Angelobacter sp.]